MNQQPQPATALTTCKACGNQFTGRYCNRCGEKVYTDHDRSMVHFFEEGLHFVTHFEGTLFTTLGYLFTKPGKLSQQYTAGIRKSLFKPVSLFLLLIVIYLVFPVFEGLNMKLYYHVHHNLYGSWAMEKALAVARSHHWTDETLATNFHLKSEKVSKFLLLVLLPFTALFFWALTFKKRRFFFDQMVFATEINSVFLIWGFMVLPLLLTLFEFIIKLVSGNYLPVADWVLGLITYLVLCLYVFIAVQRFYNLGRWKALGIALLFYFAHNVIVQVFYKFLLFYFSLKLLH